MKKAILYETLDNNRVKCILCRRRCIIQDGGSGFCLSRLNMGGTLYSLIYGIVSAIEVTPIEDKPIIRFHPGSNCLSIGTYGCNFRCKGCQNHELSWGTEELNQLADAAKGGAQDSGPGLPDGNGSGLIYISPDEVIEKALELKCEGVAFTYNEPTIWAEYILDVAKLAKESGLYTVYVTNSWLTYEHLDLLGPYIDAMALDIKSLDDSYYSELCGVESAVTGVLDTCVYAAKKHNIHVETRTCVVPGYDDATETLTSIAEWIRDNLGKNNVWHLLRFFPKHELSHLPATPLETLGKAEEIGRKAGLEFVNVVADKGCD